MNQADVDRGLIAALYIRQAGAWAADIALTGKSPVGEEIEVLPKAIDEIGKAEAPKSTAAIDQREKAREEKRTPDADNVSISFQPLTDEQEQDYFNRHWRKPDRKVHALGEKEPQNSLQNVGWPTKEQVVSSFQAWEKGGEAGLLEWVKNNHKKKD